MPLTDAKIRTTKPADKPQKLADGGGLYLEVRPTGAKLWRYRYRIAGKENVFAIGDYPNIGLSDARELHRKARGLVEQGIHPSHNRQAERLANNAANANTFEAVAREWMAKKSAGWTPYYLRQVENFLSGDVFPYVGKLPIRSVTAAHLLEIIRRIEGRGAETVALLVRQWSSAIFRYAVATLRADSDPAAALKGAIHRPKVEHRKPLSREQIAEFATALDEYGGYRTTVIALRLMLLTFVRTVELRKAEWSEFDLDRAEWRIPAERMKMREPHIVPLSRQAVELLRELHTHTGGRGLLFPNYRNPKECMTATTLNRALERMGFNGKDSIGFSAHGFRATASTILNEMGYQSDVIERQLAHAERNKVRTSYNQAEYMKDRRTMMQEWADMVENMMKPKEGGEQCQD
ncbi:MAG: integrase [Candidatus Dactylopiibacterium carminicum]|uniref:Integrase n=1 Tax=Candidatus Dactylopiibacterium carminicum TaxID=857335 RepID=A0A272EUP0_9RHOO|nr:integrase arm-type DNA-binding domain-containing protein [Candidatus Dactylopiibacterium carminicum]KAF7600360.1 integrase [Candidatus Dactylopiibacterium carminicum]PAS93813.1 MAG: integrase [Candidatus Dactylopiibacterium carminicum]PAS95606.1 MAG: integrase [Candidatus Dactylopiibacterium carminicum]PAT00359.1 MAG: integrase [Candidatus Dactylopiibacterium carminicum]